MNSLAPLHYRTMVGNAAANTEPYSGKKVYLTHCIRFAVYRLNDSDTPWNIAAYHGHDYHRQWGNWLSQTSLDVTMFSSRRAALDTLQKSLLNDNVFKEKLPPGASDNSLLKEVFDLLLSF